MKMNDINNKIFKILIRLLKEHKMYQLMKADDNFKNLQLNTIEDIIQIECVISSLYLNNKINMIQYKIFLKEFYEKTNVKKYIIDITNNIINNSSKILIKNKKEPNKLKLKLASTITSACNNADLISLLYTHHRFHPFYLGMKQCNITMDFMETMVTTFIRRLKYTKIN